MKRFTSEASNALEGRKLIPRTFSRRQALGLLGGSLAGASLLSFGLANPAKSHHQWKHMPIEDGDLITLQCLGKEAGPRYLDGRTQDGTVGLASSRAGSFTGTFWELEPTPKPEGGYHNDVIKLVCKGDRPGPRYLDGRTYNGTVGLAPDYRGHSGSYWKIAWLPQ